MSILLSINRSTTDTGSDEVLMNLGKLADSPLIAVTGEYRRIRFFSPETGGFLFDIDSAFDGAASTMCLCEGQPMLAVGEWGDQRTSGVAFYDVQARREAGRLIHKDDVSSLLLLPPSFGESDLLVSGSDDEIVRVWSLRTEMVRTEFRGHNNPIWMNSLCCFPSRSWICSGSWDHSVRVWDLPRECLAPDGVLSHPNEVNSIEAGSLEYPLIMTCARDSVLRGFSMRDALPFVKKFSVSSLKCDWEQNGEVVRSHPERPHLFFVSTNSGYLLAFDIRKEGMPVRCESFHEDSVYSIVSIGRGRFASCCTGGTIRIWNDELKVLREMPEAQIESFRCHYALCCVVPFEDSDVQKDEDERLKFLLDREDESLLWLRLDRVHGAHSFEVSWSA